MNLTKQETVDIQEWVAALKDRNPQKLLFLFQHPVKKKKFLAQLSNTFKLSNTKIP